MRIEAPYINLNKVIIIADTITMKGININIGTNQQFARFIGTESEDYVIPYEDLHYVLESDSQFANQLKENGTPLTNELMEMNEKASRYANTEIEYYGEEVETVIEDLAELYGRSTESFGVLSYEEIAKKALSGYTGKDEASIQLGKVINLKDANEVITYKGFNYTTEDGKGYIAVATHSKEALVREIVEGQTIPENYGDMYYLSSGEFYYSADNAYHTLENVGIAEEMFYNFLDERKCQYYNLTKSLLAEMEMEYIAQLNNLVYVEQTDYETEVMGSNKSYDGQSGANYGGIDDCARYLKDRYGGTIKKKSSKSLRMACFKQSELIKDEQEDKEVNNCTLAAITRILYYYWGKGYKKIDDSYFNIYEKVEKVAKKYGYTDEKGTFPTKINNIVEDVLKNYGYSKCKCNGIYIWWFDREIKDEIDADRPVIMNILKGFYRNHTVTVCGYATYTRTKKILGIKTTKTYNMVEVYDSYRNYTRFIDYSAFAHDYIVAGFGSFNTIHMKK